MSAYAHELTNQVTEKTKFTSLSIPLAQKLFPFQSFWGSDNAISILLINVDRCFMVSEVAYLIMSPHFLNSICSWAFHFLNSICSLALHILNPICSCLDTCLLQQKQQTSLFPLVHQVPELLEQQLCSHQGMSLHPESNIHEWLFS